MRSILGHMATTSVVAFLMASFAHAQVVFTNITEETGVAPTEWLTESVAWGDFDNDGDLDLIVTADMGEQNRLWRNDSHPTSQISGKAFRFGESSIQHPASRIEHRASRIKYSVPMNILVHELAGRGQALLSGQL